MSIVPTTIAEMEEIIGMFEEVITINTEVASKVFTNKIFNIHIHKKNNQQNSKDIFMNEREDEDDENEEEEEEVSCFDSLSLLINNN